MRTEAEIREMIEQAKDDQEFVYKQGWVINSHFYDGGITYLKWVLENS